MQSKRIQRLAKRIRRLRDRGVIWREVCLRTTPQILKADRSPDTGMAYQIAYRGKEPDREVQKRLGLPETCTKCHRRIPKKGARKAAIKSEARLWWEQQSHQNQEAILKRLHSIRSLL